MWKDVIGHTREIQTLQAFIRSGRVPHALLFSGLKGLGKTMVAVEFFKALNCLTSPGDPCDRCRSCLKTDNATHPDLLTLNPNGALIKVEDVRAVLNDLGLKPFEARYRLVLVEPAEQLNEASSNAMLKTLEEPPDTTIFLLVSHKPKLLLPTILSRCQEIRFSPIEASPTAVPVDPALLRLTAGTIGGLAESDRERIGEMRAAVLKIFEQGDPLAPAAKNIAADTEAPLWLAVIESFLRDIMVLSQGGDRIIHEELRDLRLPEISLSQIEPVLDSLSGIRRGLKQNLNLKIAFADLFLQLSRLAAPRG